MTQLLNRQTLDNQHAALHAHSTRHHRPYALAMCDIDHFKTCNDTYGHQAGDDTLRRVATTINTGRHNDLVYRYGGEEFLILLPEQEIHGALLAAERIRANVQALGITHHAASVGGALTISIGVAEFDPDHPIPAEQVLKAADDDLYQAKSRGRNQITGHELNVTRTTVPVRITPGDGAPHRSGIGDSCGFPGRVRTRRCEAHSVCGVRLSRSTLPFYDGQCGLMDLCVAPRSLMYARGGDALLIARCG